MTISPIPADARPWAAPVAGCTLPIITLPIITLPIIGPRLEKAEGAPASLPAPQVRIRRVRPAGRDFPDISAVSSAAPQGGGQDLPGSRCTVCLRVLFTCPVVYASRPAAAFPGPGLPWAARGLTEPLRRPRGFPGRAAGPARAAMPSGCFWEFSLSTVCQETVTCC